MSYRTPGILINDAGKEERGTVLKFIRVMRMLTGMETPVGEFMADALQFPVFYSYEQIIGFNATSNPDFSLSDAKALCQEALTLLLENGADCMLVGEEREAGHVGTITSWIKAAFEDRKGAVIGLYGGTGNGKTTMLRQACENLGISTDPKDGEMVYVSVPTWAPEDAVGIPYPAEDGEHFKYLTLNRLNTCKVFFADEFNRQSHPKVLNSLMQLLLEHRINDQFFPELRVIILAWNPSDDEGYVGAEEIDKAVLERIDYFLEIKPNPIAEIIAKESGCSMEVAETVIRWWNNLKDSEQEFLNPRRLSKICRAYHRGHDVMDAVYRKGAVRVNMGTLTAMLQQLEVLDLDSLMLLHWDPDFISRFSSSSQEGAQLRNRFVDLVNTMKERNMMKEFAQVRHLYDHVHKDHIPGKNKMKGLYNFIVKSVRASEGADAAKTFEDHLEEIQNSVDKIREELNAGIQGFLKEKENTANV